MTEPDSIYIFDFEGQAFAYHKASDLLEAETPAYSGIFEPVLEPEQKRKVLEYFLSLGMGIGMGKSQDGNKKIAKPSEDSNLDRLRLPVNI